MKLIEAITLGILFVPLIMFVYVASADPDLIIEWIAKAPDGFVLLTIYCATIILLPSLSILSASNKACAGLFTYLREKVSLSGHTIIACYEPPADIHPAVAGFLVDKVIGKREFYATLFKLIIDGQLAVDEKIVNGRYEYFLIKNKGFDSSLTCGRLVSDHVFYQGKTSADMRPFEGMTADPSFLLDFIQTELIKIGYLENPYVEITPDELEKDKQERIRQINHSWGVLGMGREAKARWRSERIKEEEEIFEMHKQNKVPPKRIRSGYSEYDMIYTETGIEERVKWLGFKDYLQTAERFRLDEEKVETFSKFLPYAIALGVETQWAHRFENMEIDRLKWFRSQAPDEIKRHDPIRFQHLINFMGQLNVE